MPASFPSLTPGEVLVNPPTSTSTSPCLAASSNSGVVPGKKEISASSSSAKSFSSSTSTPDTCPSSICVHGSWSTMPTRIVPFCTPSRVPLGSCGKTQPADTSAMSARRKRQGSRQPVNVSSCILRVSISTSLYRGRKDFGGSECGGVHEERVNCG